MKWYSNSGKDSDIVLYSKVSLSRNLASYPFPCKLSTPEKLELNGLIRDAICDDELKYTDMNELSKEEIVSLAEKHLISPEFASASAGRAVLLSEDEDVSVMLQEDDHAKICVLLPGLCPDEAWKTAEKYDSKLENAFQLAFDEKLGYLTQNPANLGTGLRVTVLLHLPALSHTGEASRLSSTVSKLGMTLRPTYSEHGKAIGDIYTLSNQVTLGITEDAAIKNLSLIASQLVAQEREQRSKIMASEAMLDKIFRAFGVLKYARILSGVEFASLISLVRLGASEGIIDIDTTLLTKLFVSMQSATLLTSSDSVLNKNDCEKLRAEKTREALS